MTIQPIKTQVFKQTPIEKNKSIVHFKYNPQERKMIIECQPIKPYCIIDQLNLDKFYKEESTIERT